MRHGAVCLEAIMVQQEWEISSLSTSIAAIQAIILSAIKAVLSDSLCEDIHGLLSHFHCTIRGEVEIRRRM
jgi:hypothetical protein